MNVPISAYIIGVRTLFSLLPSKISHSLVVLVALVFVGCSGVPKHPTPIPKSPPILKSEPKKPQSSKLNTDILQLRPIDFNQMQGWQAFTGQEVIGASQSLRKSCEILLARSPDKSVGSPAIPMTAGEWHPICATLNTINRQSAARLKAFFEQNFPPLRAEIPENSPGGVFTGYYEAELHGSLSKTEKYQYPIYGLPSDLITLDLGRFDSSLKGRTIVAQVNKNRGTPYPARKILEKKGNISAPVLYYVDDYVDLFVLHVQGSGRVVLNDGTVQRVGYAGNNGHKFGSVARYLMQNEGLSPSQVTWQGIRIWLNNNPQKQTDTFANNPRYIFFRNTGAEGPFGAMGVPLTPLHSLAVDPKYIPLGMPLWLEITQPGLSKAPLNTLVIAQDTGNAIKGPIRGDFFWGYGDPALAKAGIMKSRGTYVILLPNTVAGRMLTGE